MQTFLDWLLLKLSAESRPQTKVIDWLGTIDKLFSISRPEQSNQHKHHVKHAAALAWGAIFDIAHSQSDADSNSYNVRCNSGDAECSNKMLETKI